MTNARARQRHRTRHRERDVAFGRRRPAGIRSTLTARPGTPGLHRAGNTLALPSRPVRGRRARRLREVMDDVLVQEAERAYWSLQRLDVRGRRAGLAAAPGADDAG